MFLVWVVGRKTGQAVRKRIQDIELDLNGDSGRNFERSDNGVKRFQKSGESELEHNNGGSGAFVGDIEVSFSPE